MITLQSIRRISWAAVSQFEGRTTDDRPVYVRYKWGELTVHVGLVGGHPDSALAHPPVISMDYGDDDNFDIVWNEVEVAVPIKCVGLVEDSYQ